MCGITGLIYKNAKVEEGLLEAMSSKLVHRGPDGHGAHAYNNVGIAHRRLSFIDVEGGKQPLCNEDGTVWITYNGELYNFQELTKELKSKGHIFKTKSDTETIVHAYEEWGKDCVKKFRGMFAFAIVDENKKEVFLARDHIGIKPLFYSNQSSFVAFASELQAFKPIPDFDFEIDVKALDQYLWLQYIPAPHSIFKNVKKLEPGYTLTFNFSGEEIDRNRYWDFAFKPNNKLTENEWVEQLDSVLRDSVKKHLVSEVPFGAFLSGGLDSTAVVSYMQEVLDYPVKTFSIGFEEQEFNELPYAQQVADKLGTDHHVDIVKQDALGILPDIVKHYGEPFGDSSAIPTYYVCKMASSKVKMVLSGDGGDEALAGYSRYGNFMHYEYPEDQSKFKESIRGKLENLLPSKYPPRHTVDKIFPYVRYINYSRREALWKDEYKHALNKSSAEFTKFYNETKGFGPIQKLQYVDMKIYLPSDILPKVDVASMMHSLEVRTPLIDQEVWKLAAQIPEHFNMRKIGDQWSGKLLLKKIVERKFPKEFVYREKMGFTIPRAKWFGEGGEIRNHLEEIFNDSDSYLATYFTKKGLNEVLKGNHDGDMWLLLVLEYWLRDFKSVK